MMELFLVVRREGNLPKMLLGRFRLEVKKKQSPSKGILAVKEVTQKDSGSSHGFEIQGKTSESGETSVKLWKCWCEC